MWNDFFVIVLPVFSEKWIIFVFHILLTICVLLTANFDWGIPLANGNRCDCRCRVFVQSLRSKAGLSVRGREQRGESSALWRAADLSAVYSVLLYGIEKPQLWLWLIIMEQNGKTVDWDYLVLQKRFGLDENMPQRFDPIRWYHFLDYNVVKFQESLSSRTEERQGGLKLHGRRLKLSYGGAS